MTVYVPQQEFLSLLSGLVSRVLRIMSADLCSCCQLLAEQLASEDFGSKTALGVFVRLLPGPCHFARSE